MSWPSANIDWREVLRMHQRGESPDVQLEGGSHRYYVLYRLGWPEAVVCWESRQARLAQRFLDRIAFRRCSRRDCGIRVGIDGGECGHHRSASPDEPGPA